MAKIAFAFLALVLSAGVASAEVIKEIIVEDNKKTTADTVELIAKIEVGDDWSPDMTERVKTDLVSSGLFKDVEVFWSKVEGGVRVNILVKDKHSWVIAPAFYNQPTNTGGGVGFGENNLFGLNQKLLIYGQVATGDTFFIGAWVIPAIGGTRFYAQFDTYLKQSRVFEYAPPGNYISNPEPVRESRINYLNGGVKLGIELFRGVKIDSRLRGAKVSYPSDSLFSDDPALLYAGGNEMNRSRDLGINDDDPIPAPGKAGTDVSNELVLTIDRRANWYGIQSGHKYSLSYEQGLPSLGSDFKYWLVGFGINKAWKVFDRHNFILKMGGGYGHQLPFQQEFQMGGPSMRGWLNNQFRGDVRANVNLEYSVPLFTIKGLSFRGLGFLDSGYVTFLTTSNPDRHYLPGSRRDQQDALAPFKNSVGVGTRLYLRQIVLPLLGLDIGYGLESRDVQVYLAIGLTD
ncbi:MAG: BamA/TamA family outer membrane protein [Deltaproteobacteria bacterium]|nr:BamA/TamA family outer membrane protein [Deltaproteobacteria bacterium]